MIQPKFALIPSGYKNGVYPTTDGKIYTILPNDEDSDYTDFERNGFGYRVKPDGLLEQMTSNDPRIDHTTECPALLLETNSLNSFTFSEDLTQSEWSKATGNGIRPNEGIAPDGNKTADEVYTTMAGSFILLTRTPTTQANQWASFSVFIKNHNDEQDFVYMETGAQSTGYSVYGKLQFRFSDESFSIIGGDFVEYYNVTKYANGWYRLELTIKNPGYINGTYLWKLQANKGYGRSMYVWGAQHENQKCYKPTSYIPTLFSTVTRQNEIITGADIQNVWNDVEGVLYLDIDPNINPSSTYVSQSVSIGVNSGTGSNLTINFKIDASNNTFMNFSAFIPFTTPLNYNHTIEFNQRIKCAVLYKTGIPGAYKIFVNGSLLTTVFASAFPAFSGTATARLCGSGSTSNRIFGRIYDYRYYDKELTDNEIIELTTI